MSDSLHRARNERAPERRDAAGTRAPARRPELGWPSTVALALSLTGCQAVAGIFKAGVWVGVIAVVVVLGLVAFAVNKLRT